MPERYLGQLKPDMDVCDVAGDKVGTLAHVHRSPDTAVGAESPAAPAGQPAPEEILEVKTGLLGLGSHYYIPLSAVQEVLADSVFVSKPKEEFESSGWREKPPYLDQLE